MALLDRSPGKMLDTAALDKPLAAAGLRTEVLECRSVSDQT
jgi:hypothetical protein